MRSRLLVSAASVVGVAGLSAACVHPRPHPTTTTTVPSTIPVDGWAITGRTLNRNCFGPTRPDGTGCSQYAPAGDMVTVTGNGVDVTVQSAADTGRFRVPVGPGTYTVTVTPPTAGISGPCPPQTAIVSGPPIPTDIGDIHCTIQQP